MSTQVVADVDACQGYANCLVAEPEMFDLGDDGKVVVLAEALAHTDLQRVKAAVASCPASALRLQDAP